MDKEKSPKKDIGQVFLEELNAPKDQKKKKGRLGQILLIPFLAVFTGLIVGGIFIVITDVPVYKAFGLSFGSGLVAIGDVLSRAFIALFTGAFGNPAFIIQALQSGDPAQIRSAFVPITESLVISVPYILAGLAVALGFRSGVFNIGAEGQLFIGAMTGTFVAYSIPGLPMIIHLPLSLLAGFAGGALWGFIPGWLKARTGGHEVINTIMLNYIAFLLNSWLLRGPMKDPTTDIPISPTIQPGAMLPQFFEQPIRFNLGFFLALAMVYVVYWFLFKTTWGFNLRAVGSNSSAARYAGINVPRNMILAMSLSGGLAALAGVTEILGLNHHLAASFSSGYGFDSIALALLGNNHPVGVLLAALLFGALRNGSTAMQLAGIPSDIIPVMQAVILIFVSAPTIIRTIYRVKAPPVEEQGFTVTGWGGR